MATYLVTGAAGFIGSRTSELLLEQGHEIIGIDSLNDAYDVRLKQHRVERLLALPRFRFQVIDVTDLPAILGLFSTHRFDGVIHLAGRAGVRYSMENPHVYMDVNARGTLNVLEGMRLTSVRKIVFASTSSLYAGQPIPFHEGLPVNQPISVYAASKKAAEVMCYTYHHQFQFDVSIVRYFTVYGPAGRPDMSPFRFIKWTDEGTPIELYGDGTQSRDFTYIDDIARGTIAALRPTGFETFNLGGGGTPRTLLEMISIIEGLTQKRANVVVLKRHVADMSETQADITKARTRLEWKPSIGLEEGLSRTYAWYDQNRQWARQIAV